MEGKGNILTVISGNYNKLIKWMKSIDFHVIVIKNSILFLFLIVFLVVIVIISLQ